MKKVSAPSKTLKKGYIYIVFPFGSFLECRTFFSKKVLHCIPSNSNLSGSSIQKVVAFRATAFFIANNVKNLININEYVINFFVFLLKLKKKGVIIECKIVS